jgi:hypothetical protein
VTTLTPRRIKDHFVVTRPDIEPTRFKSRPEARDWCKAHCPGSPITRIGADATKRALAQGAEGGVSLVRSGLFEGIRK